MVFWGPFVLCFWLYFGSFFGLFVVLGLCLFAIFARRVCGVFGAFCGLFGVCGVFFFNLGPHLELTSGTSVSHRETVVSDVKSATSVVFGVLEKL